MHAAGTHLDSGLARHFLNQSGRKRGCLPDGRRVNSGPFAKTVTVQSVNGDEQRNLKTALLCQFLEIVGFFGRDDVEERADKPFACHLTNILNSIPGIET